MIFKSTETEWCPESLIAVFQKCPGRDGNNCRLSQSVFLSIMKMKLTAFTKSQKDPGVLDHMMQKWNLNCEGQLDFQGFLILLGSMAVACHNSFIMATHSHKLIRGTLGPGLQTHLLSFQLPNQHLTPTLNPVHRPPTPCRPLLLIVIKQYSLYK
uniref:S100/CaBP-9k-type calcium binding subdomain domain-containing protein n=1 Tax=Panthera leo TaxID=9689 RepID=A0A8C8WCV6_PANLE